MCAARPKWWLAKSNRMYVQKMRFLHTEEPYVLLGGTVCVAWRNRMFWVEEPYVLGRETAHSGGRKSMPKIVWPVSEGRLTTTCGPHIKKPPDRHPSENLSGGKQWMILFAAGQSAAFS